MKIKNNRISKAIVENIDMIHANGFDGGITWVLRDDEYATHVARAEVYTEVDGDIDNIAYLLFACSSKTPPFIERHRIQCNMVNVFLESVDDGIDENTIAVSITEILPLDHENVYIEF